MSRYRREEQRRRRINPRASEQRSGLRTLGVLLVAAGGILTAIGLVSLFSAFGQGPGGGGPRYFWCAILGLPLLGVGFRLLKWGYLRPIGRYVAGEMAPVARDTIDYVADGIGESIGGARRSRSERPPGTVRERLERLDALRKDGLIDDEDYEGQKDRILADL